MRVQAKGLGQLEVEAQVQPARAGPRARPPGLPGALGEPAVAAVDPGGLALDRVDAAGGHAVDLDGLAEGRAGDAQRAPRTSGDPCRSGAPCRLVRTRERGPAIPEAPRA